MICEVFNIFKQMKKIIDIKKKILEIHSKIEKEKIYDEKTLKKLRTRVEFLNRVIMYLELNPSSDFVKKEIERVFKKIGGADALYADWFKENSHLPGNLRAKYNILVEYSLLKKQLSTLRFIIN